MGSSASPDNEPACAEGTGATTPIGRVAFLDEGEQTFEVPVGEGLDGRLYTNLARLAPDSLVIANDRFYIRTRTPDRIDFAKPWRIHVSGLVQEEVDVTIEELLTQSRPMGTTLLECSGNARGGSFGLMSSARWTGVPLKEVLARIDTRNADARVLVSGFDDHSQPSERSIPGASWIFTRAQIDETSMFLATAMNEAPLPQDHGFPVRLVVPGWYGCTCIKWVDAIRLVGEDEPSTPHMREFASRTQQNGEPALARDFLPASIDLAAMPVRIDRVRSREGERLLFTGIYWGGTELEPGLELLVGSTAHPVQVCVPRESRLTWGIWSVSTDVPPRGSYEVTMRSTARIPTRRLDERYYARSFAVE